MGDFQPVGARIGSGRTLGFPDSYLVEIGLEEPGRGETSPPRPPPLRTSDRGTRAAYMRMRRGRRGPWRVGAVREHSATPPIPPTMDGAVAMTCARPQRRRAALPALDISRSSISAAFATDARRKSHD